MPSTPDIWTAAAIDTLRTQWAGDVPTAEIARQLGTTKNAVVGKARRLRLPGRPSPILPRAAGPSPRRLGRSPTLPQVAPATPPPAPPPVAPPPAPPPRPVLPRPRPHRACAWPEGDPKHPAFRFCGDPVLDPARPYCPAHCRVAFTHYREQEET